LSYTGTIIIFLIFALSISFQIQFSATSLFQSLYLSINKPRNKPTPTGIYLSFVLHLPADAKASAFAGGPLSYTVMQEAILPLRTCAFKFCNNNATNRHVVLNEEGLIILQISTNPPLIYNE